MSTNPIDLTNLVAVKTWAVFQNPSSASGDDQAIQDAITAFSAWALHLCGRGNADGSIPSTSPFVTSVSYDEFYDGNGNDMLPLRNWPITAVTAVTDTGVAVVQSTSPTNPGWVIDQSKKFLVLRFGGNSYPQRSSWRGQRFNKCGWSLGTQNIEVQYTAGFSGVPQDLEMAARRIVALSYKQRQAIGQKAQAMANGAGTTSWDWKIDDKDAAVLEFYKARVA